MKEFADNNFKFDENGRKLSKWVENTEGKETLLVTSNFSFSHSVYKRHILQTLKNQGLFGKGLIRTNNTVMGYTDRKGLFSHQPWTGNIS